MINTLKRLLGLAPKYTLPAHVEASLEGLKALGFKVPDHVTFEQAPNVNVAYTLKD